MAPPRISKRFSAKTARVMDVDTFMSLVKTEVVTDLHQLEAHQNSTESTSDDTINSVDWNETENGEKVARYRQFFDSREKKLQEKIEFVKIVYRFKNQLFGDCDGHEVTPRSKEDAWKRVAAEVEHNGLESYKGKPWARLRDHDWQYVRRHALSRHENTARPGGKLGKLGWESGKSVGKLCELDRIVLEIISTTALANAVNQATNSSLFMSTSSSLSQTSQPSTDSVEQYLKTFLGSVNQDSAETPELNTSFDLKENPEHVPTQNPPNLLEMLHKVSAQTCLSVDAAQSLAALSRPTNTKSPGAKRMTSRSATAPSVYSSPPGPSTSTSSASTSSAQPASSVAVMPCLKRPRLMEPTEVSLSFEQKRDILTLRKMEVEIRNTELMNEKLEKEIRMMEATEKRAAELHQIEMRAAKVRLQRSSAIDDGNSIV